MKVYVTKWCLTQGILELEVELSQKFPDMVSPVDRKWMASFHNGEWYETFDAAAGRADQARVRKITSLKKQIAKLGAMRFDAPVPEKK